MHFRCELLSFFSIFGIQNNYIAIQIEQLSVVNCFHFSVSLGYKTTEKDFYSFHKVLWIAFIFQYLWDTKQRQATISKTPTGCELLSFFSIFGIQNNNSPILHPYQYVVNCFHFSVSLGYKTTFLLLCLILNVLWIAFIFQYLWDTKQHELIFSGCQYRCELLSFFSIFGIQNNRSNERKTFR